LSFVIFQVQHCRTGSWSFPHQFLSEPVASKLSSFLCFVQWAVTTSVDFSLAQLIQVIVLLSTGGKNGGGYMASKYVVMAFHAAILLSHAIINSLPITCLSLFGQFAAAWNMLGELPSFRLQNPQEHLALLFKEA
jgi:hypothetical protein